VRKRAFCASVVFALGCSGSACLRAQTATPAEAPPQRTAATDALPDAPRAQIPANIQTDLAPCIASDSNDSSAAEAEDDSNAALEESPTAEMAEIAASPAFGPSAEPVERLDGDLANSQDSEAVQDPAGQVSNAQPQSEDQEQNQDQNTGTSPGFPPVNPPAAGRAPVPAGARAGIPTRNVNCVPNASCDAQRFMTCDPKVNMYHRFLSYSLPAPLSPKQKFMLAYRNIRDPFNLLTIFGEAAISVASDPQSAYGPGMPGFAKYSGVSLTEDATAEFFGTFLIPSLAHQDPHYRRMPNLPLKRRIFHVLDSVVIGHGDDGLPMFNYAQVFGTIGTSALGNLYVPGRKTGWGPSADRIAVALATDPIGYAVTEFLPDVARRININVVLVQRVINRVAIEEGGGGAVQ
jgi:hypothetical protein